MKQLLFNLGVILCLYSCSSSYQVCETKPSSTGITQDKFYCFENDTVKIKYTFWADKGIMCFSIYNKMKVPLYIDWKKSSFIRNGEKLDYWVDATTTNSKGRSSAGSSFLFGRFNTFGIAESNSVAVKPQRIMFIAPQSDIPKIEFSLSPGKAQKLSEGEKTTLKNPNSGKDIAVKSVVYTEANSPTAFRNFFTFSTSENFDHEFYVNNTFYVSRISQMKQNDFYGRTITQKGNKPEYELPFKSPTYFYLEVK